MKCTSVSLVLFVSSPFAREHALTGTKLKHTPTKTTDPLSGNARCAQHSNAPRRRVSSAKPSTMHTGNPRQITDEQRRQWALKKSTPPPVAHLNVTFYQGRLLQDIQTQSGCNNLLVIAPSIRDSYPFLKVRSLRTTAMS